jgi:hypothetical protein
MKTINFSLLFAAAILLSSCGGKKSTPVSEESDSTVVTDTLNESSDESTYETESSEVSNESSETTEEASGSEDWDELLSSYEEYVDKYISFMKKATKGDMSAMSEYPALLEKAQEYCDQLENAKNDMSASQLAKYNKITTKMLKAAQNM